MRLAGVLGALAGSCVAFGTNAQTFEVSAALSPLSSLGPSEVRAVISDAAGIFSETRHGGVNCTVRFHVNGVNTVQYPAAVNTESELSRLLYLPGTNIVFVESLNYCGRVMPTAIGCAGRGTSLVIESRPLSSANARRILSIVLAHEFGHSQGLSFDSTDGQHAHSSTENALMRPSVGHRHTAVDSVECAVLQRANSRFPFVQLASSETESIPEDGSASNNTDSLESLLAEAWVHGIPTQSLAEFSGETWRLRAILTDMTKTDLWSNTVLALAVIGDESDIDFLVWHFSFSDSLEASWEIEKTRQNTPIAVGMLSGRFNSLRGLTFLSGLYQSAQVSLAPLVEGDAFDNDRDSFVLQELARSALIGLTAASAGSEGVEGSEVMSSFFQPVIVAADAGDFGRTLGVGGEFFESLIRMRGDIEAEGVVNYFSD